MATRQNSRKPMWQRGKNLVCAAILFFFRAFNCYRSLKVIDLENTLFSKSSHRCLQICTFCLPPISTKICFVFVLGTKNSSGHVQTNFLFGKVPNFLEEFSIFWKSSQLLVSTLFPPPCRRTAWRRYSPFLNDNLINI